MSEIKMSNEELENISGGAGSPNEIYNLRNFVYRTVHVPPGTLLVMQDGPGGGFMSTSYMNGESIYVNASYSWAGYLLAFKDGQYGYVDAKFVG